MWEKLKAYYSDAKPYAYEDAILLHPSEKLRWYKRHDWDSIKIEEYRESTSRRFDSEYVKVSALTESRKRSLGRMLEDTDSDDEIQSEFESYIRQGRTKGVDNPLIWWKGVAGMYPQLSKMAKDTFAVPATGSGVEREFSISGALVSKSRNRLNPTTISDLMQYKRWLARTGTAAKFQQYRMNSQDLPLESEDLDTDSTVSEPEEEELITRETRLEPIV